MANTTDTDARNVHGTNPQYLIDKIVRMKIYDSLYWKEHCFALNAESVVDKAVDLKCVGGTFGGNRRPSEFLCLILKMLQIQPKHEIIQEFIQNEDYKYVRLLGAAYLRLVGKPVEVFNFLEPLLNDYRKVRIRKDDGKYDITHVDVIVDDLLTKSSWFNITLPRMTQRRVLEEMKKLKPRHSMLNDIENMNATEVVVQAEVSDDEDVDEDERDRKSRRSRRERDRSRSRERGGRRRSSRSRSRDRARRARRSRSRSRDRRRRRSRTRSRSRDRRPRSDRRDRRRSRSRSRDRARGGRSDRHRSRSRSRSRSRDRDRKDGDKDSGGEKDGERKRTYSKIFTKKRKAPAAAEEEGKDGAADKALSVEDYNRERAKMGLAPLK